MNILGIIPARYASSRFPGKPLVNINGKTMIRRVYENSCEALKDVVVATDNKLIFEEIKSFGGKVVMTSENHKSGTDRCAEALLLFEIQKNTKFDVVINIQGDEPFINKEHILKLAEAFENEKITEIATLIKKIDINDDIFNPDKPKVIFNKFSEAVYFSRSPIPYVRDAKKEDWIKKYTFYKHLGIYGYKSSILHEITKLKHSGLEKAESLEQNRWIENGYKIKVIETNKESISIDTEDDLKKLLKIYF